MNDREAIANGHRVGTFHGKALSNVGIFLSRCVEQNFVVKTISCKLRNSDFDSKWTGTKRFMQVLPEFPREGNWVTAVWVLQDVGGD